jgi:CDP-diacylglycerol--serine O-phosphatidyltransferase
MRSPTPGPNLPQTRRLPASSLRRWTRREVESSLDRVVKRRYRRFRRVRELDLRKTLFVLPNLVTLSSIFCGFSAIQLVATDNPTIQDFYRAAILLMFAMLFDMLDGRIARMTRTQSAFGLQLDSLADIISFGVAPSLLVYKWSLHQVSFGMFIAFLFTASGAVRLARFNVMSSGASGAPVKPGRYTTGLPIPPAAGILIAMLLADYAVEGAFRDPKYALSVAGVTVLLSLFMVSSIKFRSFKDLRFNIGTTVLVLFAVGSSVLVWRFTKPQFVLLWLLIFYIAIGLFETLRSLATRTPEPEPEPEHDLESPAK